MSVFDNMHMVSITRSWCVLCFRIGLLKWESVCIDLNSTISSFLCKWNPALNWNFSWNRMKDKPLGSGLCCAAFLSTNFSSATKCQMCGSFQRIDFLTASWLATRPCSAAFLHSVRLPSAYKLIKIPASFYKRKDTISRHKSGQYINLDKKKLPFSHL